jgi:hypothetical protein
MPGCFSLEHQSLAEEDSSVAYRGNKAGIGWRRGEGLGLVGAPAIG